MANTRLRKNRAVMEANSFDPFHYAQTVISDEHRLTHDGMVFYTFGSELDIPDGQTRNWAFRTGAIPPHFKRISINASEGPVIVELNEEPTFTGGTPAANVVNCNRLSSNVPLTQLITGIDSLDVSDPGTPLLGALYIPQAGNQGVSGESGLVEEFVLKPNTDYLFTLTNDPAGAGTADIYVGIVFYEISYNNDA